MNNKIELDTEFNRLFAAYHKAQIKATTTKDKEVHRCYANILKFVRLHPEFYSYITIGCNPKTLGR